MPFKTLAETKSQEIGTKFQTVGLVTESREKRDKNGNSYWIITIMDKSSTLEAKVWSSSTWVDHTTGENIEISCPSESPLVKELVGRTVGVFGTVTKYREKPQYQFSQVWIVNQNKEEYRPDNFIRSSPISVDKLEQEFWQIVNECKGEPGEFLRKVFRPDTELWIQFKELPAAVAHHHAYAHGLIEHTLGVTRSSIAIARSYIGCEYAPDVSIVTAGAILHDIGKLDTYKLAPSPQSTLFGTVLDHIATGYARFTKLADEYGLSELTKTHIGHIILSHHGQREFGSPVLPATPEAMIVAAADNLDFYINSWTRQVERLDGGLEATRAITEYDMSTQRRLWKWRPTEAR